jgi:transcription antitermination factor NusG
MKTDKADNNWYVFYTRPNAEKAIVNRLLMKKYAAYLPLVKILRHWRNRQNKFVSRPLFRSYVFVRTIESEIYDIIRLRGILRCVKCGDRFSIVPDKDIRCIEQMLALRQQIYAEYDFTEGEHVRVISGPLTGYEGLLIKRKGKNRFGIVFDDIKQCACIDIDVSMLEKA